MGLLLHMLPGTHHSYSPISFGAGLYLDAAPRLHYEARHPEEHPPSTIHSFLPSSPQNTPGSSTDHSERAARRKEEGDPLPLNLTAHRPWDPHQHVAVSSHSWGASMCSVQIALYLREGCGGEKRYSLSRKLCHDAIFTKRTLNSFAYFA